MHSHISLRGYVHRSVGRSVTIFLSSQNFTKSQLIMHPQASWGPSILPTTPRQPPPSAPPPPPLRMHHCSYWNLSLYCAKWTYSKLNILNAIYIYWRMPLVPLPPDWRAPVQLCGKIRHRPHWGWIYGHSKKNLRRHCQSLKTRRTQYYNGYHTPVTLSSVK